MAYTNNCTKQKKKSCKFDEQKINENNLEKSTKTEGCNYLELYLRKGFYCFVKM